MRKLSQSIDAHYWERRSEVSHESLSHQKSEASSSKSNPEKKKASSSSSKPSAKSSSSNSNPKQKSTQSSSSSNLSTKLTKDGKITDRERQRRMDNNLCLYCGGSGHNAKDCHKASNAKAHAAKASKPEGKSDSSDTSKNILSSLPYSAQTVGCVVPDRALPEAKFNTSTLSDPNSFFVSIRSSLSRNPDTPFCALIDCGSSHCFVDPKFVSKHRIPTSDIPPI
jgi:hypothetical protein